MTQETIPAAKPSVIPTHRHMMFCPTPHPHQARNVNFLFEAEKKAGNFNKQVAVAMTRLFQAMPTFWLIMAWIVLWIIVNATIIRFDPLPWPLLLALASVPQLPLMVVIMVGQGLLGRQQELQSEEQFNTTQKMYHDIEQVMAHLCTQDQELLKQTSLLVHLMKTSGISAEKIEELQNHFAVAADVPLPVDPQGPEQRAISA